MGAPFWSQNLEGFEGPLYAPDPWDTCSLGGLRLPGIIEVSALPTQAADIQQPNDRDGAAIVMRGYLPGPVDIKITIWTPRQWEVYQQVLAKLWKKPGKIAPTKLPPGKAAALARAGATEAEEAALDIIHPALNGALGIKSIVILGVGVPTPTDRPKQGRVVHWKCEEYVPTARRKATSKVKGSRRSPTDGSGRSPIARPTALDPTQPSSGLSYTPVNMSVQPPSSTSVDP